MTQSKVTSETKGKRHSYAQLKTEHFSGDYLIKILGDAVIRGDKKRIRIVKEIRRIN